ncbi:MAG: PKD domain-containing protein, partial [Methanogenium sp.]|nr:PKD domain-containing protein [Methanogenium sp.]
VTYPDWATLPENSSLPADLIYIQAVDLMSKLGAGEVNVTLCTLTVRGDAIGETKLTITSTRIDDDVGGRYAPETTDAILVVENHPPAPAANFIANVTSGYMPLTVQFTDTSADNPASWLWTFGDGATSSDQNPVHTYTDGGNYTVTLSINGGEDTCTRPDYISVTPVLFGDANNDGEVNQLDTLQVLKEVVGMAAKPAKTTDQFKQTDVHRNGVIEVGDAMFIAQYNVGLRDLWFAVIG